MPFSERIAERAVGGFPISIATSLAIESACGVHPEIVVKRAPILDYEELWINVRTLFRNFMGSLDKIAAGGVDGAAAAETIAEEMDIITSIIQDHTGGRTRVVFYISNYAGLELKYKFGVVRMDNTLKQKEYTAILNQALGLLIKRNTVKGETHPYGFEVYNLKLTPDVKRSAMLLTHYAFDLFSSPWFKEIVLLESHTGAIKGRAQWYTKYLNGKELPMIPFREDFIQIFGDSETFRPADAKLKKELIDVATKYKWTAVVTRDKIVYGIDSIKNPYAKEILRSILV